MAISVVEIQARWYKIKYIYEKVEKKILYLLKCNKETQEIWILTANFAVFYLAHVIEQPNFRIPNPQYFVYLLDQTVGRDTLQFIN